MDAHLRGFANGQDHVAGLVRVLDAVRLGRVTTKPEAARLTGMGRNVVSQRVTQLMDAGLLAKGQLQRSTGGRAPRGLRFNAETGRLLVAELGVTSLGVAISDLAGTLLVQHEEPAEVSDGPVPILTRVAQRWEQQLSASRDNGAPIWGVGIGLPGPVEFATGRPVAPPVMPGWDDFDVRSFLADRFGAPVWVDNEVNVMALGELRAGLAQGHADLVYVKVGSGIGAGLITRGSLHRGAQGCAGDIGHVTVDESPSVLCRCGKYGCLEALAGGAAIARDAERAAREGRSTFMGAVLDRDGRIGAETVTAAATRGDPVAVDLLAQSARLVGVTMARMVNFFNPSLILVGGGVSRAGDAYLAEIRHTIISRSLPLATRALQISRSPLGDQAGLRGAAFMVADALLSPEILPRWLGDGSPAGRTELMAS